MGAVWAQMTSNDKKPWDDMAQQHNVQAAAENTAAHRQLLQTRQQAATQAAAGMQYGHSNLMLPTAPEGAFMNHRHSTDGTDSDDQASKRQRLSVTDVGYRVFAANPQLVGMKVEGTVESVCGAGYMATVRAGDYQYQAVLFSPVLALPNMVEGSNSPPESDGYQEAYTAYPGVAEGQQHPPPLQGGGRFAEHSL